MKLIRKNSAFARTSFGVFVEADEKLLDASDLDFYLFNREARMDEVWRSVCAGEARRILRLGYWESGRIHTFRARTGLRSHDAGA